MSDESGKEIELFGMLIEDSVSVQLYNKVEDEQDLKKLLEQSFLRTKEYYTKNAKGGLKSPPLPEPDTLDLANRIMKKFESSKAYDGLL